MVGLIRFEERFRKFLAASPATLVHVHGDADWESRGVFDAARKLGRAPWKTSEAPPALERCAEMYRR